MTNIGINVGDELEIINMEGEPQYAGKKGVVTQINEDPWGEIQIHGTWGGCCLYWGKDLVKVIHNAKRKLDMKDNMTKILWETYQDILRENDMAWYDYDMMDFIAEVEYALNELREGRTGYEK